MGPGARQQVFDLWGDCPSVVCPGKGARELCPVRTSPCTPTNRCGSWETKVSYFSSLFFCIVQAGAHSCSLEKLLVQPGSWSRQGAGTCPAASPFCPSLPLCRAVKGHAVKLLAEGRAVGTAPEQQCPGPGSTQAAEQVTQAGREGSFQSQCQALAC